MGIDVLVVDGTDAWDLGGKYFSPNSAVVGVDGLANARNEIRHGRYDVVLIDPWWVAERLEASNDYRSVRQFMDEAKSRRLKVVVATGSTGSDVPKGVLDVHAYDGFFEKPYDPGQLWALLYSLTGTKVPPGIKDLFRALDIDPINPDT